MASQVHPERTVIRDQRVTRETAVKKEPWAFRDHKANQVWFNFNHITNYLFHKICTTQNEMH